MDPTAKALNDLRSPLTVIPLDTDKRPACQRVKEAHMPKDNLSGKNLDHVNLSGTDMSDADMSHSSLRRSQLKGTKLNNADLAESDLRGAHLGHADVTGTNLRDADLSESDLRGVDLGRAASVEGAKLTGARGVSGELANAAGKSSEQLGVGHVLEEVVELNRQILEAVRSLFDPRQRENAEAERRGDIERIDALRQRRDALENRLTRS